ncbi:MAG: endolytic transglycosylase MltG [Eubacteriales bacterium]|jgi:UPF0755 protein
MNKEPDLNKKPALTAGERYRRSMNADLRSQNKNKTPASKADAHSPGAPSRVTSTGPAVPMGGSGKSSNRKKAYHYYTTTRLERIKAANKNADRRVPPPAGSGASENKRLPNRPPMHLTGERQGTPPRKQLPQRQEMPRQAPVYQNTGAKIRTSPDMPRSQNHPAHSGPLGMGYTGTTNRSRITTSGADPRRDYSHLADTDVRSSVMSSAMKAVIYIVFLLVTVSFLSYYMIIWGNDIFAFVKSQEQIVVTIPEYATIKDISEILEERSVIRYPTVFRMYAKLRNKDQYEFEPGDYTVSPSMSYDKLINIFRNAVPIKRAEITLTFSEGMTVEDIINVFVDNGIGTKEGFVKEIREGDFSDYWFIKNLQPSPNRKYRLEGYLYPDTYNFYQDSTEYAALRKMLSNFNVKFDERYTESCEALGMTVDDVIILASMIQSEAKFIDEYTTISSVFHNRLRNPGYETAGYMQSDATIQYTFAEHKTRITHEDTLIDDPYNTYVYKGLPPGPICNPSLNAINAALYPAETDYYYFISERNGYSLFGRTAEEHQRNIEAVREQYR